VVDPVCRGAAGAEGVLQAAVEAFYHSVGLLVVGGSLVVLDVEQAAEGRPQGGSELGPAFCRDSESAHPSLKQCIRAVYCCSGCDRNGLRPAGGSVNDGEQIGKTLDGGRGPTRSTLMWLKRRVGTCTWQWTLAGWQPRQAFAQAVTSVERPFQTYLEEMRRRVEMFEYLSPKVPGHQRAECVG
jgi:hypothetical protein